MSVLLAQVAPDERLEWLLEIGDPCSTRERRTGELRDQITERLAVARAPVLVPERHADFWVVYDDAAVLEEMVARLTHRHLGEHVAVVVARSLAKMEDTRMSTQRRAHTQKG